MRPKLPGLIAAALGGYQRKVADVRSQRRQDTQDQRQADQQTFSNSIQSGTMDRLQKSLDLQLQQAADQRAQRVAGAQQATQARESQRNALRARGVPDEQIDGIIDSGVQDDYLKPQATIKKPWEAAGFTSEDEWNRSSGAHASATRAPVQDQRDHFSFPVGTDANGNPVVLRANTSTGQVEPTDVGARDQGGTGASAMGQVQQARLLAAVSEARIAHDRMTKFEDSVLQGKQKIGMLQQAAGTLSNNLSGTHSVVGSLLQATAEGGLQKTSPDVANYLRDAQLISRAEQLMSPRGGSEAMARAAAFLARAGTGAEDAPQIIDAARKSRLALFGTHGGIAQALTPEQNTKLNTSVNAIDHPTGGRGGAPSPVRLSPAEWIQANPQQSGESDAAYKARYRAAAGQQ